MPKKKTTKKKELFNVFGLHCLVCQEIIWSRHRHDYRSCACPDSTDGSGSRISIDGGRDYCRVSFANKANYISVEIKEISSND